MLVISPENTTTFHADVDKFTKLVCLCFCYNLVLCSFLCRIHTRMFYRIAHQLCNAWIQTYSDPNIGHYYKVMRTLLQTNAIYSPKWSVADLLKLTTTFLNNQNLCHRYGNHPADVFHQRITKPFKTTHFHYCTILCEMKNE